MTSVREAGPKHSDAKLAGHAQGGMLQRDEEEQTRLWQGGRRCPSKVAVWIVLTILKDQHPTSEILQANIP